MFVVGLNMKQNLQTLKKCELTQLSWLEPYMHEN